MIKWLRMRVRRWLGIEAAELAAYLARTRVDTLMQLVHGGVDLHNPKFKMKNWAVFAIRGKKRDVVKVVDLSTWDDHDMMGMISHLEGVAQVRVDSPIGDPRCPRNRRAFLQL